MGGGAHPGCPDEEEDQEEHQRDNRKDDEYNEEADCQKEKEKEQRHVDLGQNPHGGVGVFAVEESCSPDGEEEEATDEKDHIQHEGRLPLGWVDLLRLHRLAAIGLHVAQVYV